MAMNGWEPAEPEWWLNLQADPHATVQLSEGTRQLTARAATGAECAACGTGGAQSTGTLTPTRVDGRVKQRSSYSNRPKQNHIQPIADRPSRRVMKPDRRISITAGTLVILGGAMIMVAGLAPFGLAMISSKGVNK
jgi:hypothetical protein